MKQKASQLKALKLYYLFILILTIILVVPTHIFSPPLLMPLRFPHYLEMMEPLFGVSWPVTFEIYHYTLIAITLIFSFNILGLTFTKWRNVARFSSAAGILIFSVMILFFFFLFINVNLLTSLIYGFYCIVLLIVDALTFKAIARR